MNPRSFRFPKSGSRLLAAALSCLPLGSACSSDSAAPEAPITFSVEVTTLDGQAPEAPIDLRCDHGGPVTASETAAGGAAEAAATSGVFSTLAVAVSMTPVEVASQFVLRPAHACGGSTRCGYVRIEGLNDTGQVLSSVDTSTTEGVLQLDLEHLPTQIRVSLIRGLDQKPLQNPDATDVTSSVTPSFVVPSGCGSTPSGDGGAAGAGGVGAASAGESSAGGVSATPSGGAGAAGDGAMPAAAGDGTMPAAGAGGQNGASSGAGGA
jgi:hypothetical protein